MKDKSLLLKFSLHLSLAFCTVTISSIQANEGDFAVGFENHNRCPSKQNIVRNLVTGVQYARFVAVTLCSYLPPVPNIIKEGIPGYMARSTNFVIKSVMNSTAENFSELFSANGPARGHGTRIFDNMFNAFGSQFGEQGAGTSAMNTVFKSVGSQFENNGAARNATNGAFKMAGDLFKNGGEARNAMNNASSMLREELAEGGHVRLAAQEGVALAEEAIAGVGEAMNLQTNNFLKTLVKNYAKSALITVGTAGAIITSYYGSKLLWQQIEKRLNTPSLIIKSSKKSLLQKIFGAAKQPVQEMIFSSTMTKKLDDIAKSTVIVNQKITAGDTTVKYRNLLLWGPPGTGKTMFAEKLALSSGMEYAMMSGASFAKFEKGKGIQALDELFAWAQKSSKGLLLFIDEAESFLSERSGHDATSDSYLLLNSFLNHTGTRSNKFMIVFATNHPDILDKAMGRRIDDSIKMDLPELEERYKILNMYMKQILLHSLVPKDLQITVESIMSEQCLRDMAQQTDGLSCGELEGIMNSIKTSADASESGVLTKQLIEEVIASAIAKNQQFASGFKPTT